MESTLLALQEQRESRALADGYKAFLATVTRARLAGEYSRTPAAHSLIARGIQDVEQTILAWLNEQQETDKNEQRSGRKREATRKQQLKHFATKWFNDLGPSTAAYIALKVVLDGILKRQKYAAVCLKIAGRIVDELRYRQLKLEVPELVEWKLAQFSTNNYEHMQRSLDHTVRTMLNPDDVVGYQLTVQRRLQLGSLLLDFLLPTGIFQVVNEQGTTIYDPEPSFATKVIKQADRYHRGYNKITTYKYIIATEETSEWLLQRNDQIAWRAQQNIPMVVPPLDWQFGRRGGYLFALRGKYPMVRENFVYQYDKPEKTDLPLIYATLNALQRTAWTINRAVYSAMEAEYEREMQNRPVLPKKPKDIDTNEEARLAWKKAASKVYNLIHQWKGEMRKRRRVLDTANDLLEFERFYFPYSCDFRGRVYPIADYLHPQGSDSERALLMLADGKEVSSENEGEGWLAVHGANCYGEDQGQKMSRLTYAERTQWVDANEARIIAAADSPASDRWWTLADDPWQFLGFCFEWRLLLYCDNRNERLTSRIPVYLDGTCNGLQHFAAAFRDDVGGAAVNVTPNSRPQDIYQRVADRVLAALERETSELVAARILGLGLVTRKLAKRPTMTFSYGSKQFGFKRQLREYMKGLDNWPHIQEVLVDDEGKTQVGVACALMARLLWEALEHEVVMAVEGMQWMQDCAAILAVDTKSVEWVVPFTGLPVRQGYVSLKRQEVRTVLMGNVVKSLVAVPQEDRAINNRKETNAISPNVIHSLDAAALVLAVTAAIGYGIRSFAMVHDSYGTLAADVPLMRKATREGFVTLYTKDVIAELHEQWQRQTSEELPESPKQGSLNLQDVLKSTYFFA